MMGVTHTAISLAGVTIITGSVDPRIMLLAAIGSQIPDLDTTKSWVGLAFYPFAKFLEERFPHRSVTHSFFTTFAIAVLLIPIVLYFDWKLWLALPIGHLLSCFSDCATKLGCQFFYPLNKDNWVLGLNPRNRLETGKPGEYGLLVSAVCIFTISFYVITGGGGLKTWATRTLFQNNRTAVEVLRQENQKAVAIEVEGTNRADNSLVKQKFWAIAASGNDLIVKDDTGRILEVGASGQVIPKIVKILPERLKISFRQQKIEEAEGGEWINSLPPNSYISGTLQIEEAAELTLPIPAPGTMIKITKSGDGVTLDHATPSELKPIEEFYILSGQVLIKEL